MGKRRFWELDFKAVLENASLSGTRRVEAYSEEDAVATARTQVFVNELGYTPAELEDSLKAGMVGFEAHGIEEV